MEDDRSVVVGQGDVVSAERCHMGADGQTQETVHLLTLLSQGSER